MQIIFQKFFRSRQNDNAIACLLCNMEAYNFFFDFYCFLFKFICNYEASFFNPYIFGSTVRSQRRYSYVEGVLIHNFERIFTSNPCAVQFWFNSLLVVVRVIFAGYEKIQIDAEDSEKFLVGVEVMQNTYFS